MKFKSKNLELCQDIKHTLLLATVTVYTRDNENTEMVLWSTSVL